MRISRRGAALRRWHDHARDLGTERRGRSNGEQRLCALHNADSRRHPLLLFFVQRYGTAAIGGAFGPVMLIWFVFIAVLGAIGVGEAPMS